MILRTKFVSVCALLGICSMLLSACSSINSLIMPPTLVPTTQPTLSPSSVAIVKLGDVVKSIEFTGRVISLTDQQLQFKTTGRVAKILVMQGDLVKKDQLLAQLDSPVTEYDLRRAQVALDKADLIYNQTQVNTPQTQKDYAIIVGLKKAEVDLAKIALDELNGKIAATKLTAPADGMISKISITENSSVDLSKAALILSDPTRLEISGTITDPNAGKLFETMPVTVSPANNPDISVAGVIRQVLSPTGSFGSNPSSATITLSTWVTLNGDWPVSGFTLGTQVTIKAILENRPAVLWLPPSALRSAASGQYVFILDGNKQTRVDVLVGLSTDSKVEITQGLKEGQLVILPK
jgi:RND family efflux transporter MFP subunit